MPEKMWAGRAQKDVCKLADDFNSSIHFDYRLYRHDIKGSMAHAAMLASCGIIAADEAEQIIASLGDILDELNDGTLEFDMSAEDIHMFVEAELTKRIGDTGKKLHTARSRNDQVALDIRMYLRDESEEIIELIKKLINAVLGQAKLHTDTILPGYTHLQRAQPILLAHHFLAYAMMLLRDISRIEDAIRRMNKSPIGSCALAGTTYPTNRMLEANQLGFVGVVENSIDGVSDRDFCVELISAYAVLMMHLSRFSEEIVLWSSWEFKFIELDDSYTTGSSIMPQKKNPDIAELVRGKTGRVYGDLTTILTMLKGLPLAYNKDMQEDKEAIFDAVDTVKLCLTVFAPMISGMKVLKDNMYAAASQGFINATDLADYLTKKGVPFRTAYKISGQIVAYCIKKGKVLEQLSLDEFKSFEGIIECDVFEAIDLHSCVNSRISEGGTGKKSVELQIMWVEEQIK